LATLRGVGRDAAYVLARLGDGVAAELRRHGVTVHTSTLIRAVKASDDDLTLLGDGGFQVRAGLVLVVTGVRPDTTSPPRPASPPPARRARSRSTGACAPTSWISTPPGTAY